MTEGPSASDFMRYFGQHIAALERFMSAPATVDAVGAALSLLAEVRAPLLMIGLGKSGAVARKLASTFTTAGIPALFLHASDALHGELGWAQVGQGALLISRGGRTREVVQVATILGQRGCARVVITGDPESPLARQADALIHAGVADEAVPFGRLPTASTTLHQAIGDALLAALLSARPELSRGLADNHPAGTPDVGATR
ncbi:MAG: SIS domain-containing protein [Alphaproteobacteria bacterium]|nr:SIS domain-containing protein [Alphaproteobacteria bacterium]